MNITYLRVLASLFIMSWIKVIDEDEAHGCLKEVYDKIREERGKVANIMKVHSLNPNAMEDHLRLYVTLMFGEIKLERWRREMIAVYVSKLNKCNYCMMHHGEALASYWGWDKTKKFIQDYTLIDLLDKDKKVLNYVKKLTVNPHKINEEDIKKLREIGLNDSDILNINLITSYFNFVNRIALGLGVEYSEDEIRGYNY